MSSVKYIYKRLYHSGYNNSPFLGEFGWAGTKAASRGWEYVGKIEIENIAPIIINLNTLFYKQRKRHVHI